MVSEEFREFVETLDLENFKPHELLKNVNKHPNSMPERELWDNIVPPILIVQKLRKKTGVPIYLSSTYRNEAYNEKIGGVEFSQHQAFLALDIRIDAIYQGEVRLRELFDILFSWREKGKWFESPVAIKTCAVKLSNGGETPHKELKVRKMDEEKWEFKFEGGLAYYEEDNYIHVDVRGENKDF